MHFLKIAKELQKTLENTHIMDTPIWADDRTNKKPDWVEENKVIDLSTHKLFSFYWAIGRMRKKKIANEFPHPEWLMIGFFERELSLLSRAPRREYLEGGWMQLVASDKERI